MTANPQRYSNVAIALHWGSAALMIFMIFWGEGLVRGQYNLQPPIPASNPALHASLGMTVLILGVARLAWRLMNPPPADVAMPRWQAISARVTHWAFYALMILIPLSGMAEWGKAIAGRHPEYANFTVFGLFPIPYFSMNWFANLHGIGVNVAMALVFIHVAAALKHQFFDKNRLLVRMAPHS